VVRDDEVGFTAFVEARGLGLLRFATAVTGDRHQAEDLLQGALERAYGKWSRVAGRGDPERYVKQSIVNAARDGWRKQKRHPEVYGLGEGSGTYLPFDEVITRDVVRGALASLPPRQRLVVVLRYWEGMTEAETADLMGISVGTVKSQAHRAMKTLREQLALSEEPHAGSSQGVVGR
jgi:RNA polymerase sigma-70 factor (sigma-E family)